MKTLEIDTETIKRKLSAKWVKEDSFVPISIVNEGGSGYVVEKDIQILQEWFQNNQ